ncbi:hypothetical protein [Acuticoccus kandeliae]|uniref:hypothetical protein n=1 Tax=Acuticoccus kandeliae TaxID=2073160 RepID=UPI001475C6A5|nr:hypothetical protein [Acuticoccus kandeliae]
MPLSNTAADEMGTTGPSTGAVEAELAKILSSPHLEASERRKAFLRFIVDETLAGRSAGLKGHVIAVEVFGRDETFDSANDPVVRLEARRLRRDLDSYYVEAGRNDPLRITIPKGAYVPHFDWNGGAPVPPAAPVEARPPEPEPASTAEPAPVPPVARPARAWWRRRSTLAAGALAILLVVACGLYAVWRDTPVPIAASEAEPAVYVRPFEALGSSDDERYLAAGISQELIADLMGFRGFRLYGNPVAELPVPEGPRAAYTVSGSVRQDGQSVRVSTQLQDAASGQILWFGTYDKPLDPKALIKVQSDIAAEIATILGQPYGIVSDDLNRRTAEASVREMTSYLCVLRAYTYRRSFSKPAYDAVTPCLERATVRDPNYSDAWAMLGWLYLDGGRFEFAGAGEVEAQYEKARVAAEHAVQLEPNNVLALKALSSIQHYRGRFEEAEALARRAVALNPNDPDTLAQLGWRLAVRGQFEEGIPLLDRAIGRTVDPPGWYFHLVAIDQYLRGDYHAMLRTAERSAVDGSGISQALIAIACGALEDGPCARGALDRLATYGVIARDPAAYFHRHGATDEIVKALSAGLARASEEASRV